MYKYYIYTARHSQKNIHHCQINKNMAESVHSETKNHTYIGNLGVLIF